MAKETPLTPEVEVASGLQLLPQLDGGRRLAVHGQSHLEAAGVEAHRVPQPVVDSVA